MWLRWGRRWGESRTDGLVEKDDRKVDHSWRERNTWRRNSQTACGHPAGSISGAAEKFATAWWSLTLPGLIAASPETNNKRSIRLRMIPPTPPNYFVMKQLNIWNEEDAILHPVLQKIKMNATEGVCLLPHSIKFYQGRKNVIGHMTVKNGLISLFYGAVERLLGTFSTEWQ